MTKVDSRRENLNRPLKSKETELVIKKTPHEEILRSRWLYW